MEVGSLQGGSQKRRAEVGSEQRVTLLGRGKCHFTRAAHARVCCHSLKSQYTPRSVENTGFIFHALRNLIG